MNVNLLESCRTQLKEERHRLLQDLEAVDNSRVQSLKAPGETTNNPQHPAERDVEDVTRESILENNFRDEVQEIDDALTRIDEGSFGQCLRCGKDISEARLEGLPASRYCIRCEQAVEQEQAG